ncbi:hypothetical protein [Arthrobacter sp. UYCu712]|uniref:hypothetical protein n=1 Tax=Arthrobacter sp. UYCu712 TaxID=3156340 RepID=UPI0033994EF0
MAGQLDSPAAALTFLETYLRMLPGRLERIHRGIDDLDDETSHDAVLSLKVASNMTGAPGPCNPVTADECGGSPGDSWRPGRSGRPLRRL